ncbi:MAG: hypothetical protein J5552_06910, partial [Prevotella sp.]|nr:hypothetical protein [Prevotella sp.]
PHYASDCTAKVRNLKITAKQNSQKDILQFDPLTHSTVKLSCKLTYTPKKVVCDAMRMTRE